MVVTKHRQQIDTTLQMKLLNAKLVWCSCKLGLVHLDTEISRYGSAVVQSAKATDKENTQVLKERDGKRRTKFTPSSTSGVRRIQPESQTELQ